MDRLRNLNLSKNIIPVIYDALTAMMLQDSIHSNLLNSIGNFSYRNLIKYNNKAYSELLKPLNPILKSILSQYQMYISTNPDDASGAVLSTLYYFYLTQSAFLFKKGIKELVDILKNVIIQNNGMIVYNTEITKIIIENNNSIGVLSRDGKVFNSDYIISNINTHDTFINLIDNEIIPDEYLQKIKNIQYSSSVFQVYIGMPEMMEKYCFNFNSDNVFINYSYDLNFSNTLSNPTDNSTFLISNYSYLNKELSNKEKTSFVIVEYDNYTRWEGLNDFDYKKQKEETQNLILKKFEKITGIDLKEKAEIIFSATPRTYKKYMSNQFGEMIGPKFIIDQSFKRRTSIETPIKNMFLTGAYTQPGGGVSSVISGGINTIKVLLKSIKE